MKINLYDHKTPPIQNPNLLWPTGIIALYDGLAMTRQVNENYELQKKHLSKQWL